MGEIHTLEELSLDNENVDEWRRVVNTVIRRRKQNFDLRTPDDAVFRAALRLFFQRAAQYEMWLAVKGREEAPAFGLTIANQYVTEAAEIVHVAAEGYIFNLRGPRKRAKALLEKTDPLPLKTRVDAKLKVYIDAFGPDDGEEVELAAPQGTA